MLPALACTLKTCIRFRFEEFPASSEIFSIMAISQNSIIMNGIPVFTVHPVPAPFSVSELATSRIRLGTSSQKLILFSLGNAISAAPIITGTR